MIGGGPTDGVMGLVQERSCMYVTEEDTANAGITHCAKTYYSQRQTKPITSRSKQYVSEPITIR